MHIIKLAIIPALALISFGYHNQLPIKENAKTIEERMAKVNDTLYMGKAEVSNEQYARFVTERPQQSWLRPDSAKWSVHPEGHILTQHYFSHNSYKGYPVVAVTHEAALEYCKWLTEVYMADPKRKFKKVRFALPSHAEWKFSAHAGKPENIYPFGNKLWYRTGEGMACFRVIGDYQISFDSSTQKYIVLASTKEPEDVRPNYTAPIYSFWPNPFGIYNQSGNVAEMVLEKGIAAGGSYNDPGYDVRIASVKQYDATSAEIGFRVAMYIQQ
jgi:formylglycine-generating enzyme required for sulfatase activity